MATRKHSEPRPVILYLDQFPGAAVQRIDAETYYPVYQGYHCGGPYRSQHDAECQAIAEWVRHHPEVQAQEPEAQEAERAQAADDAISLAAATPEVCDHCGCVDCACAYQVRRAAIFDQLCQVVDEQRAYWSHIPSRVALITDAWGWLLSQDVYYLDRTDALLVPSESTPGQVHRAGLACTCTAGRWGRFCRHQAAADLIGRAWRAQTRARTLDLVS